MFCDSETNAFCLMRRQRVFFFKCCIDPWCRNFDQRHLILLPWSIPMPASSLSLTHRQARLLLALGAPLLLLRGGTRDRIMIRRKEILLCIISWLKILPAHSRTETALRGLCSSKQPHEHIQGATLRSISEMFSWKECIFPISFHT